MKTIIGALPGNKNLTQDSIAYQSKNKTVNFEIKMPPHSVAAVTIEFSKNKGGTGGIIVPPAFLSFHNQRV